MEIYDSEKARKVYASLRENSEGLFPISVSIGKEGTIENFVYGHHLHVPGFEGRLLHLSVEGSILIRATWSEVQSGVQHILESSALAA